MNATERDAATTLLNEFFELGYFGPERMCQCRNCYLKAHWEARVWDLLYYG